MKKHPVDDLFKRKLTDLDKEPSANAWTRIQEKQQPKPRVIGWVKYAAASVLVGALGGYLILQNSPSATEKAIISRQEVVKPEQPVDASQRETMENAADAERQIAEVPEEKLLKKVLPAKSDLKTQKVQSDLIDNSVGNQKQDLAKLEVVQSGKDQAQNETPLMREISEPVNLKSVSPQISTPSIASLEVEPTRTIVVAVESEPDHDEDKPKASKFSKVFRQLKNARAGERVDWDEVGFNPKTLVAKVDDRLRSKEEKTEKYQNPRTKL
ncbi:hypothetical protein [Dyadobacter sp. Leaf189]|uniref:hypothetical protein n=1 Tax=Dyadobacter sp. Leaf189 TaxID=1736295 RepID=UPI000701705F|nr:hypothetical protein [Dyadobacter sp. Leaf189]KQS25553.1 hypothetical protein ASG33_22970 [Dyadobacter sp. Leaf189]